MNIYIGLCICQVWTTVSEVSSILLTEANHMFKYWIMYKNITFMGKKTSGKNINKSKDFLNFFFLITLLRSVNGSTLFRRATIYHIWWYCTLSAVCLAVSSAVDTWPGFSSFSFPSSYNWHAAEVTLKNLLDILMW